MLNTSEKFYKYLGKYQNVNAMDFKKINDYFGYIDEYDMDEYIKICEDYIDYEINYDEFHEQIIDNCPDLYCILSDMDWDNLQVLDIDDYINEWIKYDLIHDARFKSLEEFSKGLSKEETIVKWNKLNDWETYFINDKEFIIERY